MARLHEQVTQCEVTFPLRDNSLRMAWPEWLRMAMRYLLRSPQGAPVRFHPADVLFGESA